MAAILSGGDELIGSLCYYCQEQEKQYDFKAPQYADNYRYQKVRGRIKCLIQIAI